MHTLVMGIGNTLLGDDGAGIAVVRTAEQSIAAPSGTHFIDAGTLSFTLAARVGRCDRLVVVDAAQLGEAPGSIAVFVDGDMDRHLGSRRRSVHEVGLLDLLDMARLCGDLPARRALVAIQPGQITWDCRLSEPVRAAVNRACEVLEQLLLEWSPPRALPA